MSREIVTIDGVDYYKVFVGTTGPFLIPVTSGLTSDSSQVAVGADIPAVPSASSSVSAETSFGISSNAGSSGSFSRGDHTHGTPTDPLSGGETHTITVAKITLTGTDGSITWTNGIITAHVDPT